MMKTAVSVIVPCYNMEKFLPECLQSILTQTLKNIEVICIDDGSTDRTGMLLDEAARRDSRLRVVHQQNSGVAAARNYGISIAAGHYVIFIDPDDFYPDSNTLELLYRKATEHHAVICGGAFSCYVNETGKVVRCFMDDLSGYIFSREGFLSYREYQFDFGYHRFVYNREFLVENSIFFPPYARFQDPPFFVKAMITAERFYAVEDVVYRYRIGTQPDPTSWPPRKLHDMIRGHIDVLHMSAEAGLSELHGRIVRRFEADTAYEPVMKSLREGNDTTRELVQQFQAGIRTELLPKHMVGGPDGGYVIRELRDESSQTVPEEPGRLIGYWQMIGSVLRFFRKFGIRRTVRLVYEILTN